MAVNSAFLILAGIAILSPGPSVVFTLTNTLKYGFLIAILGIAGTSVGVLIVAVICASGIGLLLSTSIHAFTVFKSISVIYLFYLGVRLWRIPCITKNNEIVQYIHPRKCFIEGAMLQLTNPYVIFFTLFVFPQFIIPDSNYMIQFLNLASIYSFLVIIIHFLYALCAKTVMKIFSTKHNNYLVNKLGAIAFIFFGAMLAITNL